MSKDKSAWFINVVTMLLCSAMISHSAVQRTSTSVTLPWKGASLNGITLGMSKDEVLNRLGEPNSRDFLAKGMHELQDDSWLWDASERSSSGWLWYSGITVFFDSGQRAVVVGSRGPLKMGHLSAVVGDGGTSTIEITPLLGNPTQIVPALSTVTDTAWIYHGPDDLELRLGLAHSKVYLITLGHARFLPPHADSQ